MRLVRKPGPEPKQMVIASGSAPPAPVLESVFMEMLHSIRSSFDVLYLALVEPESFVKLTFSGNIAATYFIARSELATVEELLRRDARGGYVVNGATLNRRHRAVREVCGFYLELLSRDDLFKERVADAADARAGLFVVRTRDFLTAFHLVFNDFTAPSERSRLLRDYLAGELDLVWCEKLAVRNFGRKQRVRGKRKREDKAASGGASALQD